MHRSERGRRRSDARSEGGPDGRWLYDLWGDTVNTASRLESHGLAGRIQVGEAAYRLLCDRYAFEDRDQIELKGKGRERAYLLVGRLG
ncbi:MAG TPA: adenylate/guanylate cyclase domain-containing protein [Candidatus Limnocylindrales bacterium]|jgi:class 3 adenylate cyclase|nr:adenylate/guanylate cyclase domain-containing protein [Candidatus Limnocylindrales bacterium]